MPMPAPVVVQHRAESDAMQRGRNARILALTVALFGMCTIVVAAISSGATSIVVSPREGRQELIDVGVQGAVENQMADSTMLSNTATQNLQDTDDRDDQASSQLATCSKDTGGTCSWFSCDSSRGATCNHESKCVCMWAACAVNGKCVADTRSHGTRTSRSAGDFSGR